MSIYLRSGGTWQRVGSIYQKSGGTWRQVERISQKSGGTWSDIYNSAQTWYMTSTYWGGFQQGWSKVTGQGSVVPVDTNYRGAEIQALYSHTTNNNIVLRMTKGSGSDHLKWERLQIEAKTSTGTPYWTTKYRTGGFLTDYGTYVTWLWAVTEGSDFFRTNQNPHTFIVRV